MSYKIALIGGGSGGHVYPLIAVARSLKKEASQKGIDLRLRTFGDGSFIKKASSEAGIPSSEILRAKWRPYFSVQNFIDILKIPLVFIQSLLYFWAFMPDVVFAKGGYTSVIPVLVAKFYFIPVVIHDSDSIPGRANLFMSKFANQIFVAFSNAKSYFPERKTSVVGNPLRNSLIETKDKAQAAKYFSLSAGKPTILIIGGSQGAKALNDIIFESVVQIAEKFQIIHQVGSRHYNKLNKELDKLKSHGEGSYGPLISSNYRIYPFFSEDELKLAYSIADIVISRAGAGTLFEVSALGKPIIAVPIKESSSGHQKQNAIEISKFGGIYIEEPNLTTNLLLNQIERAMEEREEISKKIRQFSNPDSAREIATYLLPE